CVYGPRYEREQCIDVHRRGRAVGVGKGGEWTVGTDHSPSTARDAAERGGPSPPTADAVPPRRASGRRTSRRSRVRARFGLEPRMSAAERIPWQELVIMAADMARRLG